MKHLITTLFIFTLFTPTFTLQSHAAIPPAPVLATGQTLCYDASGATIACADSGQDGESQAGLQWPTPRFVDNGDQTQTDKLTGLIWSKNANLAAATKTWQQALDYIKNLNSQKYLGYSDWRLPNVNELATLGYKGQANSATWLNGQGFSNVQSNNYWSSSSHYSHTNYAWIVSMDDGYVSGHPKSDSNYVWLVRAGQLNALTIFKTGQTTCNDANGAAIACSGTGQDGELQTGVTWPTPRFVDNGDQTQTDKLTGLIWSKNANLAAATKTWQQALDYINNLNSQKYLGYSDWRLPNVNELATLGYKGQANSATWLNGQGFSNVHSDYYWSSSSYSNHRDVAWIVGMGDGFVSGYDKSGYYGSYVWPVRAGQFWFFVSTSPKFGTVTPPTARQIEVGNPGSSVQSLTSIALTGTNAAEFTVTSGGSNPCGSLNPTLAASASCTLMLGFTPISIGVKSASLDITANGTTNSIALSGTAFSTIYGVVTDQATGLGVAGAQVTLNTATPTTTTTNTDGSYTFSIFDIGTYISVSKTGYQTTTKNGLVITATASAKADVMLPTVGTLNVTSTSLPWASPNVAYNNRVMVAGGTAPYTFAFAYGNLPTGISLDTTTGTISGTPTGIGSYTFAIGVQDNTSTGYSEKEYTIALLSPLQITTASLPASLQGSVYSATVTATGGKPAYSFSLTNSTVLPTGLTLNNATSGAISGTSRVSGTFNITIRATDSSGITADKSYTLILAPSVALTIDTTTLPQGVIGTAYSTTLAASGGVPARTFSVAGTLPAGLTFSTSTGKLSGTPTAAGLTNLTFTVSDYSYPTAQTASIVLPLRIWSSTPVNGTCGSSNSGTFTTAPTTNLCTNGTATAVTGTGPWNWTCTGFNGGTTANCSASITTSISKPGDCDSSGTVTIAEVQSAINMFLGLKTAEACVDQDSNSSVSIAEVQKVINSFLGL